MITYCDLLGHLRNVDKMTNYSNPLLILDCLYVRKCTQTSVAEGKWSEMDNFEESPPDASQAITFNCQTPLGGARFTVGLGDVAGFKSFPHLVLFTQLTRR